MTLSLVQRSPREPVSVRDLQAQLRVDDDVDTRYLDRLARVVRSRAERFTRRALITQTWDVFLDQWPTWDGFHGGRTHEPVNTLLPAGGYVFLPKAPLQSVSFVKYTDLQGAVNTWDPSNYLVDAPAGDYCRRGRLSLGWVKVWPIVRPTANCIQIRLVCGYGARPEDVPDLLVQGMLLDAGHLYENRSTVFTGVRAAAVRIPDTSLEIYRSFRSL